MKISVRKSLLCIVLYGGLFRQVYSYLNAPYTTAPGSYAWEQLPLGNNLTTILEIIVLIAMIGLFVYEAPYFSSCATKPYILICIGLFLGSLFWTIMTALETGVVYMLYSSTAPFVYMTGLCVCVGMDEISYQFFLRHAHCIGVISIMISILSYTDFLKGHPISILGNSSVLVFYIQGFWLLCLHSLGGRGQNKPKTVYAEIVFAGILAVLFNSRSWIIQTIIWLLSYSYSRGRSSGLIKVAKILVIVGVIAGGVYLFTNRYYPEVMMRLINKASPSYTRSSQYTDLFQQTRWYDFIFGRGYNFQYQSSLQGGTYSYIDNAYILMLVRYGILIGLAYPLVFLYPIWKRRLKMDTIPVFMWLAALGGLSIYCATILDIKSIALAVLAGRCLFLWKKESVEE